jgi:hypothetical protein
MRRESRPRGRHVAETSRLGMICGPLCLVGRIPKPRALAVSLTNTRVPSGPGLCGGGDVVRYDGYRPIPPVSN